MRFHYIPLYTTHQNLKHSIHMLNNIHIKNKAINNTENTSHMQSFYLPPKWTTTAETNTTQTQQNKTKIHSIAKPKSHHIKHSKSVVLLWLPDVAVETVLCLELTLAALCYCSKWFVILFKFRKWLRNIKYTEHSQYYDTTENAHWQTKQSNHKKLGNAMTT